MTNKNTITIISQQFYGNRTLTHIKRENIKYFLKGILSPELFQNADELVDLRIIKVPSSENIVIVYDQNQENEHLNEEKTKLVSCEIPEIGFKIYSRCFACRIDENGEFQSLENGDSRKFIDYFTK